jgi:hypothetical protein
MAWTAFALSALKFFWEKFWEKWNRNSLQRNRAEEFREREFVIEINFVNYGRPEISGGICSVSEAIKQFWPNQCQWRGFFGVARAS